MEKGIVALGALLLTLASTHAVHAADAEAGRKLHQTHCISCHADMTDGKPTSLYTREDRLVSSLEGLHKQVRRCEQNLGLRWFDEDIDNVVAYLNQEFYKFEQ